MRRFLARSIREKPRRLIFIYFGTQPVYIFPSYTLESIHLEIIYSGIYRDCCT